MFLYHLILFDAFFKCDAASKTQKKQIHGRGRCVCCMATEIKMSATHSCRVNEMRYTQLPVRERARAGLCVFVWESMKHASILVQYMSESLHLQRL